MKLKLFLGTLFLCGYSQAQTIDLVEFATEFNDPIELVHAGDSRFFVAEQGGIVKILNAEGTTNATPFLDVSAIVTPGGGERGLLGLAFHPDYATNGFFYINYTNLAGDTVIARYSVNSTNPSVADPSSQMILLTIDQPYQNHNGGCLRFGPDGYLYIAMGDGGNGGDPQNFAQNMESLLGKMLRIDVDNGSPYSIPPDNPMLGVAGADEIWASGLRNPWKFSFNEANGDLWIADVGQNAIEEINKMSGTAAGINYGWRCYEASSEYNTTGCGAIGIYAMPLAEYTHGDTEGCSITGGYVYNGTVYPAMQGKYFFTDYCNNKIGMVDADGAMTLTEPFGAFDFVAFGEDIDGELYVVGKNSGIIYRIIDSSLNNTQFNTEALYLYPNPAGDVVQVKIKEDANLRIFDLGGKLLWQQQLASGENIIVTSAFQSGIYLVEVESNTAVHKQKLVIR